MYAIIKTGGKQYKVKEGQMIKVEKLDAEKGDQITFDKVLQYSGEEGYKFGKPYLEDAEVSGKVLEQGKNKKVVVLKYKPKRRYYKKTGHRQPYTKVLIENIEV
ncbi:MAG TPA: 50S ribosomal protein L21 [Halanaerobiales bacterium]|nr:50S ribosomal protein L21 [Halanaerobiales bacterium]